VALDVVVVAVTGFAEEMVSVVLMVHGQLVTVKVVGAVTVKLWPLVTKVVGDGQKVVN
jgi:hypothetical protein